MVRCEKWSTRRISTYVNAQTTKFSCKNWSVVYVHFAEAEAPSTVAEEHSIEERGELLDEFVKYLTTDTDYSSLAHADTFSISKRGKG